MEERQHVSKMNSARGFASHFDAQLRMVATRARTRDNNEGTGRVEKAR